MDKCTIACDLKMKKIPHLEILLGKHVKRIAELEATLKGQSKMHRTDIEDAQKPLRRIIKRRDADIATLQAQLATHQWVSVEERLPEDANYVVFRYASSGNTFFGFYRPSRNQWFVNIDLNGQRAISDNDWPTHWMPIPTLPDHITDVSKMDSGAGNDESEDE